MKLSKIAIGLAILLPLSSTAEYRVHIPIEETAGGSLPKNTIKFTNDNDSENGSAENDLELTDQEGAIKCAYNNDNYVLVETNSAFVYTYEWKSTYFSIPLKRANALDSGYSTVIEQNNKFYDLGWPEAKTETIGSGVNRIEKVYYKICEYEEMLG